MAFPEKDSTLPLVARCGGCRGNGMLTAPDWLGWEPGNAEPAGPEEVTCGGCNGTGKVLTNEGERVAEVVRIVLAQTRKREPWS